MPGKMPASCRSWTPYASTPEAITISAAPVTLKNTARFIDTTPRYNSTPITTEVRMPSSAPTAGPAPAPCAWKVG